MAPLRIVFACSSNSCRSQMAEGWAKEWLRDVEEQKGISHKTKIMSIALDASSVFKPCPRCAEDASCDIVEDRKKVKAQAVTAMALDGVDISSFQPKTLKEILPLLATCDKPIDWLIVLCSCGDKVRSQLLLRSKRLREWNIEAPKKAAVLEGDGAYRRVSRDIRERVHILMNELHQVNNLSRKEVNAASSR